MGCMDHVALLSGEISHSLELRHCMDSPFAVVVKAFQNHVAPEPGQMVAAGPGFVEEIGLATAEALLAESFFFLERHVSHDPAFLL